MAYELPELPYGYNELEPAMSEKQLKIHHDKHHQGYVNKANALLEKLDKARQDNSELDMKATLKALSFNVAGHVLHSLFWTSMSPKGGEPSEKLLEAINKDFGSLERFKAEFTQAASTVEGSGWAALTYDDTSGKLMVMQLEKHNVNLVPAQKLLLVVDVWEHAYYLDYQNERGKFLESFWGIVNWEEVSKRHEAL